MSIKQAAHEIIDNLPEEASWDDLVKQLYLEHKITLGMTDLEVVQRDLSESDVSAIMTRLKSASSKPDDMLNTKTYDPGNAATLGIVAGIVAILFSFVFPPIAWVAAPIAVVSGIVGIRNKEDKAWVAILMAIVSLAPILLVLG